MLKYVMFLIFCSVSCSQFSIGMSFDKYHGYGESQGSDQSFNFVAAYYFDFEFMGLGVDLSNEGFRLRENQNWEVDLTYLSTSFLVAKEISQLTFLFGSTVMFRVSEKHVIDTPYNRHINTGDLQLLYNIGVKYDLDNLLGYHFVVGLHYKHPIFIESTKDNPISLPKSILLFESVRISLMYEFD